MKQIFLFFFLLSFGFCLDLEVKKCTHLVYCNSTYLGKIQKMLRKYNITTDSKDLVDRPLKNVPELVVANLEKVDPNNKSSIESYLHDNFYAPDADLKNATTEDWSPNPAFLLKIQNNELRDMANELHHRWPDFIKIYNHSFACGKNCFSSIETNNIFVVPGGRFREFYYWDSYWIIQGLLVSDMKDTALRMVLNFADMVKNYGYIFNGNRVYYSTRSQPPFLALMVDELYEYYMKKNNQDDSDFASNIIQTLFPSLTLEHKFWLTFRTKEISYNNRIYKLAHFDSSNTDPRPESFLEDEETANSFKTKEEKENLYRQITSAAETGWDFSSRWFKVNTDLKTANTNNIIPVDLNSILYLVEKKLEKMSRILGYKDNEKYFKKLADERKEAIYTLMYDDSKHQWFDYNISSNPNTRTNEYYISNFIPLYAFSDSLSDQQLIYVISELFSIADRYKGGIPTSNIHNGQQWDFPNAWPPEQMMIIEGIYKHKNIYSKFFAKALAKKWVLSNYCGFKKYKNMFEKYDVNHLGETGSGGEYEAQVGFGWTNGVFLKLMEMFGEIHVNEKKCTIKKKK